MIISLLDEPLTRPLLDPRAWPGIDVDLRTARTVDASSRAMLRREFDVAEMSFAAYLRAMVVDGAPLLALPAFTGRRFLHGQAGIGPTSAVRGVGDLTGARVAVPQYWMTSSVWHRILLRHHGVDPASITWVTTVAERFDQTPDGVRVEHYDDGRTPLDLVRRGEADVLLSPRPRPGDLAPLFADEATETLRYHRATGVFPVMHLVVVRAGLDPGLVRAVWQRLVEARQAAGPGPAVHGLPESVTAAAFSGDPWCYGVEANAPSLAALFTGAHRDGLLPSVPDPADVFIPADRKAVRR